MSTTAGDQINGALRLIGQLAEGETPSAATSQDALTAMNQMIDSWSTERLAVFSTQDQVFSWLPGFISRTLGPTGDFVGNRPILLDDSTYFKDPANGISFGIPNPFEVEMARTICTWVPAVEKVRMCNSGTEATMSAIRLARGFTKRDLIVKFDGCYHGHSDSL
jgi:hypothetical protein